MACVSENGTRGMADGPKWPFKHASVKTSQKFQRQCFSSLTEMATIILLLGSQSKMRHRILLPKTFIFWQQNRYLNTQRKHISVAGKKFGSISTIAIWASQAFTALSTEHLLFLITTPTDSPLDAGPRNNTLSRIKNNQPCLSEKQKPNKQAITGETIFCLRFL